MSASKQLDRYLESFGRRLRKLTLLQGVAVSAVVFLVVSVVGAWFSAETGFADGPVIAFRILLLLALAAVITRFIALPLRRLRQGVSRQLEERSPGFRGRIHTYVDMKEANNPLRDLLAEDALRVSASYPPERQIEQREFNLAYTIAGFAAAVLLYLLIAGPGLFGYSLRNLYAGWAFDGLLPPQSISVTPGDESVRRGANLRVTSVMQGFDPDEAIIHVRSGNRDWQDVAMVPSSSGFEFTFFSMQEPMRYYVSANGLRTPEYEVRVVDLPRIENLSLTYTYPEWTRRAPETVERGGDIEALPETQIGLTVTTSTPLPEGGELVLNSASQPLTLDGNTSTAEFTVMEEGEYYLTALVGGEPVRLSDDYFIRIAEDGKPSIEFTRPGRDWNASNIEEVLTRIEVSDDYGLESVELRYSVNGGEWQSVDLSQGDEREIVAEHIFMLEDMRATATRAAGNGNNAGGGTRIGAFDIVVGSEPGSGGNRNRAAGGADQANAQANAAPPAVEDIPLQPGDIISYYAQATDRGQTARTDMFFIQVQPFNRRFTQSQMSGGGGGGGGGPQDEISQRQRQIIVSTWNLIREQSEEGDAGTIQVNSSLLSDLQNTLREQAQTLVQRTRARQLSRDEQIEQFATNMEQAVQAMLPAAERLASVELEAAIGPAQEALQYLLRAESVFNELTVTQQQGGGGGAGGSASRDLAEMFELEMDMEKNQYETGNRASPQAQQQQVDDIMKQLDELARRQEQLANSLRNSRQLTEAQRYQQDMLRRQAEELQERMEQLQRGQQSNQQQASNQQGQQGQQGQQQGQQGQQGQPGQPGQQGGAEGQAGQEQQIAQSELQRRLESAIRAMNESAEGMRNGATAEDLQRAAEEARRQLEGAREQIAQDQIASLQESFQNMASRGEQMLRDQERMEQQLQAAMEKAVADRQSGEDPNSRGMAVEDEWALAREKQELAAELQRLQQQMLSAMQRFGRQAPDATRELERANDRLIESELEQAVSDAALYIDSGYGLYIAGNESMVTQAMRDLSQRLQRAEELAQGAAAQGSGNEIERARQQAQDLRAALERQLAQNGQPGEQQDQQANGQQGGQQQGQQQGQQGGQQQGGQQAGGGAFGDRFGFGPRNGGWWANGDDLLNGPIDLPEDFYQNLGQLTETAREAVAGMNLGTEELARMYDLLRELEYNQTNRNDSILNQEFNQMLALIEQLEVGLRQPDERRRANVRTQVQESVPEEYQDSVAEYYRRLSRD